MALVGPFALSNLPLDTLLLPFKIEQCILSKSSDNKRTINIHIGDTWEKFSCFLKKELFFSFSVFLDLSNPHCFSF